MLDTHTPVEQQEHLHPLKALVGQEIIITEDRMVILQLTVLHLLNVNIAGLLVCVMQLAGQLIF